VLLPLIGLKVLGVNQWPWWLILLPLDQPWLDDS
jgi:hypothetical protein